MAIIMICDHIKKVLNKKKMYDLTELPKQIASILEMTRLLMFAVKKFIQIFLLFFFSHLQKAYIALM